MVSSIDSTTNECSYCSSMPSRRPRVSPYTMKEKRVIPALASSEASGSAGGVIARTVSRAAGRGGDELELVHPTTSDAAINDAATSNAAIRRGALGANPSAPCGARTGGFSIVPLPRARRMMTIP